MEKNRSTRGSKGATGEVETLPLCVGLNHTLIKTDLQWEIWWAAIQRKPFLLITLLFDFFRGRRLTREIAARFDFPCIETLPYNNALLHYVRKVRATGRRVYIIAPNEAVAAVVAKLGCFDGVIDTKDDDLLTGVRRKLLSDGFTGEFEYAGNGRGDLHLWDQAKAGVLVNPPRFFLQSIRQRDLPVSVLIEKRTSVTRSLLYQVRAHQWVKKFACFRSGDSISPLRSS